MTIVNISKKAKATIVLSIGKNTDTIAPLLCFSNSSSVQVLIAAENTIAADSM